MIRGNLVEGTRRSYKLQVETLDFVYIMLSRKCRVLTSIINFSTIYKTIY